MRSLSVHDTQWVAGGYDAAGLGFMATVSCVFCCSLPYICCPIVAGGLITFIVVGTLEYLYG